MHIREVWGKKTVIWSQYEKPTLQTILDTAKQEFPDTPLDCLTVTADTDDDGKSIVAVILLRQRIPTDR